MSRQIRDEVCEGVGRIVGELWNGMAGPVGQRRSYAGVTRSMPSQRMSGMVDSLSGLETLEIVPEDEADVGYQNASATCSKVCSVVRPAEIGAKVDLEGA